MVKNKRAIILTGSELRHDYMRMALALFDGLDIIASYCEGSSQSLGNRLGRQESPSVLQKKHVAAREQSEKDFFESFVDIAPDYSNPIFVKKGDINVPEIQQQIIDEKPDVLLCYGSSLIKGGLISAFEGQFLNAHLGLSPYYRGSGTNFFAMVNGALECVGVTFMYLDAGIDTGQIIHQYRARIFPGDSPHQIGNRLITDIPHIYAQIACNINDLPLMPELKATQADCKLYKRADFTEEMTERLYANFDAGLVENYLKNCSERIAAKPIVQNPALEKLQETA